MIKSVGQKKCHSNCSNPNKIYLFIIKKLIYLEKSKPVNQSFWANLKFHPNTSENDDYDNGNGNGNHKWLATIPNGHLAHPYSSWEKEPTTRPIYSEREPTFNTITAKTTFWAKIALIIDSRKVLGYKLNRKLNQEIKLKRNYLK
jgi:hypothetical protein